MQENKRHKKDMSHNICDGSSTRCQLAFDANFATKDFRLLEISKDMLTYIEQEGEIRLVGDIAGDVVLCTDMTTYSLKKVETSNSMCIVPPRRSPDEPHSIASIKKEYYEVRYIIFIMLLTASLVIAYSTESKRSGKTSTSLCILWAK